METFNVITYNINNRCFEEYNIIPYLTQFYKQSKNKPQTFKEFKQFIEKESQYQWWSRCEYEIILTDWPCKKVEEKWDIYKQIMMNLNVITSLLMFSILKNNSSKKT